MIADILMDSEGEVREEVKYDCATLKVRVFEEVQSSRKDTARWHEGRR